MEKVHPEPDDYNFHFRVLHSAKGQTSVDAVTLYIPLLKHNPIYYYFFAYIIFGKSVQMHPVIWLYLSPKLNCCPS